MTATMTQPTIENPISDIAGQAEAKPDSLAEGSKFKQECSEVKLRISPWIGGMTRTLTGDSKNEAAAAVNVDADNFSATMRLYDPKNAYIKKANDLRNRITGYRDMMCLYVCGTWFIRNDRVDAFHERMESFRAEARTIEAEMNENRTDILESSRRKLHDNFNNVNWPTRFVLSFAVDFVETGFPKALERLAPKAAAAEKAKAFEQSKETFDGAFLSLMTEALTVFQPIIDKTGAVQKVFPLEGHPHHEWNGARVIERETHLIRPGLVPEGGCRVKLSIKKPGELTTTSSGWLTFTSQEWEDMRPHRDPTERLAIHSSQVDTLLNRISKLRMFGNVLAGDSEVMAKLNEVEELLTGSGSATDLAEELKRSQIARTRFNGVLTAAKAEIESAIVLHQATRRRITRIDPEG